MSTPDLVATAGAANTDVLDKVLGITADHLLYAVRHEREKVVVAMQKNYDTFFAEKAGGLSQRDRLLVAWYASQLSGCQALSQHYFERLEQLGVKQSDLDAWFAATDLTAVTESSLRIILLFTKKLILNPIEGDKSAIQGLRNAGIATPDIVTLAQLIAFLSYQIRVVLGLLAMKERLAK